MDTEQDTTAFVMADDGEGLMHATLATLDPDRLEVLRTEAGAAGDSELVATIAGILGDG